MDNFNVNFYATDYANVFLREATGRPFEDIQLEPMFTEEEIIEHLKLISTAADCEAAFANATERDGPSARIRGTLENMHFAGAELRHSAQIFRPDPNGDKLLWCEAWVGASGKIEDLIFIDDDDEEWGWSRGVADCLGNEQLSKLYTEYAPLMVWPSPAAWRDDGKREGVCVLKKSARSLLRRAAFVRAPEWEDVEAIAEGVFEGEMWRVQGPQDEDLYAKYLADKARDEFIRLQPPPPWLADPFGWLERRRIERGGLPGEPLPSCLAGDE